MLLTEFKVTDEKTTVWINPEAVTSVKENSAQASTVYLTCGTSHVVFGTHAEVAARLCRFGERAADALPVAGAQTTKGNAGRGGK